jgi:hypothetical protein
VTERHDIWAIADAIQMDLRAAQAKMVELRAHLAQLDLPDTTGVTCSSCGVKLRGPNTLAEHVHVSHDGPLPAHWVQADALVDEVAVVDIDESQETL